MRLTQKLKPDVPERRVGSTVSLMGHKYTVVKVRRLETETTAYEEIEIEQMKEPA